MLLSEIKINLRFLIIEVTPFFTDTHNIFRHFLGTSRRIMNCWAECVQIWYVDMD